MEYWLVKQIMNNQNKIVMRKLILIGILSLITGIGSTWSQTDCSSAIPVCNDNSYAGGSPGFGVQELNASNRGCLTANEHQSTWFGFSPQLTGTIQFSITPAAGPPTDYDFAIWGPFPPGTGCPITSTPIRCSYSAVTTATGLNGTALDVTEGAGGDGWVQQLVIGPAQVGQIYYLLVDNWTGNSNPFTLDWTLVPTNILDCTPPLPVQLLNFDAHAQGAENNVWWTTVSEYNSSHFIIEKSSDAVYYQELGRLSAAGNSNQTLEYSLIDPNPFPTTYYRIVQVDMNGDSKTYGPVVIENSKAGAFSVANVYPNPANESFFIDIYSKEAKPANVLIYDSYGHEIFSEVIQVEGLLQHEIQTTSWSSGIYIIKVGTDDDQAKEVRRVVIQ